MIKEVNEIESDTDSQSEEVFEDIIEKLIDPMIDCYKIGMKNFDLSDSFEDFDDPDTHESALNCFKKKIDVHDVNIIVNCTESKKSDLHINLKGNRHTDIKPNEQPCTPVTPNTSKHCKKNYVICVPLDKADKNMINSFKEMLGEETRNLREEIGPIDKRRLKRHETAHENPNHLVQYVDKTVSIAQIKDGMKHGFGRDAYPDGSIYEGQFMNDLRHGHGRLIFNNNEYYEGDWKDDKKVGIGKYYFGNGNVLFGEWKNNMMNGHGELTSWNGNFYRGEFKEGIIQGQGETIGHDGAHYKGIIFLVL